MMDIIAEIKQLQTIVVEQQTQITELKKTLSIDEKTYTVKQVADMLKLSIQGVLYHKREGNLIPIPGKQRNVIFTHSAIEAFKNKTISKTN